MKKIIIIILLIMTQMYILNPSVQAAPKLLLKISNPNLSDKLIYSNNGQYIISVNGDITGYGNKVISIWDSKSGKLLRTINGGKKPLAISPDDNLLATGDPGDIDSIIIYDIQSTQINSNLKIESLSEVEGGPRPYFMDLSYSPNGKYLIGVKTCGAHVWDTQTGQYFHKLNDVCNIIRYDSNGSLVSLDNGTNSIVFYNNSFEKIQKIQCPGAKTYDYDNELWALAVNPNGLNIACGGKGKSVYLINSKTGKLEHSFKMNGWVNQIEYTRDGKAIIVRLGLEGINTKLIDIKSGKILQTWKNINVFAVNSKNNTMVLAKQGFIEIWKVN